MKIKHILQLPFGTSINLDENVPESGVVGKFLTVDFKNDNVVNKSLIISGEIMPIYQSIPVVEKLCK